MKDLIISLYGKDQLEAVLTRINSLAAKYTSGNDQSYYHETIHENETGHENRMTDTPFPEISRSMDRWIFTQEDAILITYPDQLTNDRDPSLSVLGAFLKKYVGKRINTLHILPFFPYSSDDGFSIINFYEADPGYGGWNGIQDLAMEYRIMCDLVLNHISAGSSWFHGFIHSENQSDRDYSDYFITCDPDTDLSEVTRPRPYPLLTPFKTDKGKKWLWTTFSKDQIDLNFKNPEVFLEMLNILLWYVSKGADIIRLDAIAYVWKEIGTNCIHRPQVHTIVKLFRKILDTLCPWVVLITETNVPHNENISYFGNGTDEAQMVYQFPLPPLVVHALLKEKSTYLNSWAATLATPHPRVTYFNFTASHDGIGVRPLKGLVPDEDIETLIEITRHRGGDVSWKTDKDGNKSPYELNINYFSILSDPDEPISLSIQRFLLSQSIMLTMPGVPGIYFHSLIGSINYKEGVKKTGAFRSINREKLMCEHLEKELETIKRRKNVFTSYMNMLHTRKKEQAFHPQSPFIIHGIHEQVFAIERQPLKGSSITAIHNLSSEPVTMAYNPASRGSDHFSCLLTTRVIKADTQGRVTITLSPLEFVWLRGEIRGD